MVKIIDKLKLSMFTLEQMLEDIKSKSSIEIKQKGIENNFIKIYKSMQKYVRTSEQRKKAEQLLKKYIKIQVYKDGIDFPKRYVYKDPLYLNDFFNNLGKHIKINYE